MQGTHFPGIGVGAIILNDAGECLLMKRSQATRNDRGLWSIPGGAVDFGEKARDAMLREAAEECGIELQELEFIGYIDQESMTEGQHWVGLIYFCTQWSGTPINLEPVKCEELRWFSPSVLPENIAHIAREAMRLYKNVPRGTFL